MVQWSLPKPEFGRLNPVQWFVFFAITITIDTIYFEETKERRMSQLNPMLWIR